MPGMTHERQPGGTGFALRDPYPWAELAALAREGEALGYRALFLPEIASRDTLAAITGLAGETRSVLLAPGIAPLPSRTPQLLAMAAATAHERSGGRLVLGLGTGTGGPGALVRLRETVVALKAALRGEPAEVGGTRLHLDLVPPSPPPVWIAALGPNAVRLAGAVADGVLLNWCTPERVARACEEIAEAASTAGRDPGDVAVGVYVRAALADGTASAARAAAVEYAGYPAYARQFVAMGIDPGDPDAVVRAVCVTTPSQGAARLEEYRAAGAHLPVVYPVVVPGPGAAGQARATLQALAP